MSLIDNRLDRLVHRNVDSMEKGDETQPMIPHPSVMRRIGRGTVHGVVRVVGIVAGSMVGGALGGLGGVAIATALTSKTLIEIGNSTDFSYKDPEFGSKLVFVGKSYGILVPIGIALGASTGAFVVDKCRGYIAALGHKLCSVTACGTFWALRKIHVL